MAGCLMFDWTGTLVDEYELDKSICRNIELELSRKEGITVEEAEKRYLKLLNKHEDSWKWYSYPLHGDIFGIGWKKAQISELPKLKTIPNVIDVLTYYKGKGYYMCLLTNAVKAGIDLRINYLKMRKFFDLIVASDIVKSTKSTGKHLEYALKFVNTPKGNIYMIGDRWDQDILPAKRIGIVTIQCQFGNVAYSHSNNFDSNTQSSSNPPDYIITGIEELFEIIK